MSKQTAVEWYSQKHLKLLIELENKRVSLGEYAVKHQEILQQAKQKEKEQIVKAHGIQRDYSNGSQRDPDIITGEEYYNKTYGQ